MYYSKGNYEAFARPRKPVNIETKAAYLVGGGLASLAAAAFLIRDGHMAGDRITILEASTVGGGALDGAGNAENRLADPRWPRDGGPLRVPLGPLSGRSRHLR